MTNPIGETINAWLEAEGIDRDSYVTVMRRWVAQAYDVEQDDNPIHALERGEAPLSAFEAALASELTLLDGSPCPVDGLLTRMWAGSRMDDQMLELFRQLHAKGIPTGLLSNSWGNGYPRDLFPDMFDAVVISHEVGMRKPEPRIFLHAAQLLGLPPQECAFVDDIAANITAAEGLGFAGVLHTDTATTTARLSELLGVDL